jgi:excisionase family DNA binding protein
LRSNEFDPLAYIENAFLDKKQEPSPSLKESIDELDIPTIGDYLHKPNGKAARANGKGATALLEPQEKSQRFRKTVMSAPRPRRAKASISDKVIDPELQECWETLPKSIEFLCSFYDDSVTANYYRGEFKESRKDLIRRLLDPELSLEETSRLLGVCPATVRRYTNRGWLKHHRTTGGQRRFRLSNIVKFVDAHGRFPED